MTGCAARVRQQIRAGRGAGQRVAGRADKRAGGAGPERQDAAGAERMVRRTRSDAAIQGRGAMRV